MFRWPPPAFGGSECTLVVGGKKSMHAGMPAPEHTFLVPPTPPSPLLSLSLNTLSHHVHTTSHLQHTISSCATCVTLRLHCFYKYIVVKYVSVQVIQAMYKVYVAKYARHPSSCP